MCVEQNRADAARCVWTDIRISGRRAREVDDSMVKIR